MKRLLLTLLLLTGLAGVAFLYLGADARAEAPRLTDAAVTRGAVVTTVTATGTLEPVDTVEVGTQVSGVIATLGADFNQTVKRGQVVATLDQAVLSSQVQQAQATVTRLQAELERAQVQLEDAQLKLTRAEQLAERQLLAAQDVDTARSNARVAEVSAKAARAQLDQAEGSLEQARVNLSHAVITSPVDGIVLSRNVEVGQTVAAGLQAPTLFVIARNLAALQLSARVDESDVGRVAAGQPVSFVVDAYPGQSFPGTVRQVRLQPTITQNVVTYTTVIDVPNPKMLLKPGMTATLDIEVARADDVLRVPAAALRFSPSADVLAALGQGTTQDKGRPRLSGSADTLTRSDAEGGAPEDRTRVWTLVDGRLSPVSVRTGPTDRVNVAILAGDLSEGTRIVTGETTASGAAAAAPASGSPLMPSFPRRNAAGGRPAR